MTIDHAKVRAHAVELKRLLAHYAPLEPEAAMIQRELTPLIDAVLDGSARLPFASVPCGWHFVESKVAEFDDLANAYSEFAFFAKGRDAAELHRFFTRLESNRPVTAPSLASSI